MITIKWTDQGGTDRMATATGTLAPLPDHTRESTFEYLYERTVHDVGATDAFVLFFALEPDTLWKPSNDTDRSLVHPRPAGER
ncbi:hypothetical protein [Streptomyces sp. 4N124]|uniref:hypothetical protein n=1 Tax=Streptomyces sp. 4N124 TaxID=3457420 RepID=UPI003FD39EE2